MSTLNAVRSYIWNCEAANHVLREFPIHTLVAVFDAANEWCKEQEQQFMPHDKYELVANNLRVVSIYLNS